MIDKDDKSKVTRQAKSKFLADMSHEIQNSMKSVIMHSDLLKQTNLSAKQMEYIDTIYNSARKLSWVINDILDFSQLELGKVELQSIDFNLEYLINDIFTKTVEQKKDHPVDTYVDIAKDAPRNLVGDPTRLRQVLINLLSNAFKFTLKGEVGIIVRKMDDQSGEHGKMTNLQITVKDSGQGIPKERQQSIFELSSEGSPSSSWEYGGTGLGLAICKLVVEAMKGSISVESEVGKGSAFTVSLSFEKGALIRDQKIYPLTKGELIGKRAIIVDDNEIARKILKKCCETIGIEPILISASPKAVLQMLNELSDHDEIPDLILCDIMMPEMDGYDLVRQIRANHKYDAIKMIAVTSAVHVGSARSAQDSGFNGFLPKPVFLDELAKIITTVLGDKREHKTIVTRHMAEELKFKGTKVLVIEHTGPDQKLIEECLNIMECDNEFVSSGRLALECLGSRVFNLCLLNYLAFEEEGPKIVRMIKEAGHNIPIIALLKADMEKHRTECLTAGIDDFIIKPVDMIGLKRVIKRYGMN